MSVEKADLSEVVPSGFCGQSGGPRLADWLVIANRIETFELKTESANSKPKLKARSQSPDDQQRLQKSL